MAQSGSPALVSAWEKGQERAQEGNSEVTGQQGWGEQGTASSVPGEGAGSRAGKGCSWLLVGTRAEQRGLGRMLQGCGVARSSALGVGVGAGAAHQGETVHVNRCLFCSKPRRTQKGSMLGRPQGSLRPYVPHVP